MGHILNRHSHGVMIIAALAAVGLTDLAKGQDPLDAVSGRVLDADGKPVGRATISDRWLFDDGEVSPAPIAVVLVTDDDGLFSGELPFKPWSFLLMAMNADRTQGGIVVVEPTASRDEPVAIVLSSLVRVHGTLACEGLGYAPEWTGVQMSVMPGRANVGTCSSEAAAFSFDLPPGEYHMWAWGKDVQHYLRESVTLPFDREEVDLGVIDMKPSIIAQHWGKAPPKWNVTDARGARVGAQPSDYKGKWLLLEFWGYW